jgi:Xaa-Pro aminopeptidase
MRRLRGALAVACVLAAASASAQEAGRYGHYEIYDADLLPRAEYAARRHAVLAALGDSNALLVRAADERIRSNDVEYEFRQRNNMLYLSGVTEPESALLLVPRGVRIGDTTVREVLFVARRNPLLEAYEGYRLGPEIAAAVSAVATTLPYNQLSDVVGGLVGSLDTLFYDGWRHSTATEPLTGVTYSWASEHGDLLRKRAPDLVIADAGLRLDPMRLVKSDAELALLQRAVDISLEGHRETIRRAREGMYEYELEAIMEYTFRRLGAEDPGYPSIVGSGPNTTILHYSTSRRRTRPGELVLMDCGAEYHGYAADITRTFPISGRFSPEQRAIYDLVYAAQEAGINECRAGRMFRDPHTVAMRIVADGLVRLGIIADRDDARKYFNHGTSHYIGLDVHDVGDRGELSPGMVLTVEPGIYIPAGSPCDAKWWNIGVRIEDDILVTRGAPRNMSAKLARTAEEVERLMSEERGEVNDERGDG